MAKLSVARFKVGIKKDAKGQGIFCVGKKRKQKFSNVSKKIKTTCFLCRKEFKDYPSKKRKYCSYECYWKSLKGKNINTHHLLKWNKNNPHLRGNKKEKIEKECVVCNKKMYLVPWEIKYKKCCSIKCQRKWQSIIHRGEKGTGWKGGINPINDTIRKSLRFRLWREAVFKRDDYICWICRERGGRLHSHHLLKFSDYSQLRFDISNGLTLCEFCHKNYTNFWVKAKQKIRSGYYQRWSKEKVAV